MTVVRFVHVGRFEDLAGGPANGPGPGSEGQVIGLPELDRLLDREVVPQMITAVAISETFDCFDVAQVLSYCAYRGKFRILPKGLPRPEILVNEARRAFPDLDIAVFSTKDAFPLN